MVKNVDRAQRRELISQAAERQRRRRAPAPARRAAVTCPNCLSLFEDAASRPGNRSAPVESRAPGTLLS